LAGDREADVVVNSLPATSLKPLLGEEQGNPLAPPLSVAFIEPGRLSADS
jgi:hypothetical protein